MSCFTYILWTNMLFVKKRNLSFLYWYICLSMVKECLLNCWNVLKFKLQNVSIHIKDYYFVNIYYLLNVCTYISVVSFWQLFFLLYEDFLIFFIWLDSLFTLYVEVVTRYLYTNSDIRTSCAYDPLDDVYFYIVMFIIVLKYLFFKYIHYDLVDKYIYHHFQDIVIKWRVSRLLRNV